MKTLLNLAFAFLLITIVIVQSGCKKETNTEYPDVTATADTVYGTLKYKQTNGTTTTVTAWPFGTATFNAVIGLNDILATATVNDDGTFMLVLPAKVSGIYLSSLTETASRLHGTVEATPETIRFLEAIQYKVKYTDNGNPVEKMVNLYTLNADLSIMKSYFFNFYDSEGTLQGTASSGSIFNWSFTKGWGKTESFIISSTSDAFNSKSVSSVPADAVWLNW